MEKDYKDILLNEAEMLRELWLKYSDRINDMERDAIAILLENTYDMVASGRLDNLNYEKRNSEVMSYQSKLEAAIRKLNQFQEQQSKLGATFGKLHPFQEEEERE